MEVVKKLSKKYNKEEAIIKIMIKECKKLEYNIDETIRIIDEFEKRNNCY